MRAVGAEVESPPGAEVDIPRLRRLPTRRFGRHSDPGHDLGVTTGLSALSLDALSSVAYGPEAMIVVLVAAGASALKWTVPVTLVIVGMLTLLVISYSQVIVAYPDGGGAYAVAKRNPGRWVAMLAAASLVVDYVLTVAVSLAAGAASLGSVFPALSHHLLLVSVVALLILTAINMFGIAESAKALLLPAAVFLVSVFAVIIVGPFHSHPVAVIGTPIPIKATETLGLLLLLKAFAAGCSALTGARPEARQDPAAPEETRERRDRSLLDRQRADREGGQRGAVTR
jgi:amino acid transporter